MFRNRLDAHVLPRFGGMQPSQIGFQHLMDFSQFLSKSMSTTSVSNYLTTVKKILKQALSTGAVSILPEFPKIKIKIASRGTFTVKEYWDLRRAARALRGKAHPSSRQILRESYTAAT
jgi:hypothetical protein